MLGAAYAATATRQIAARLAPSVNALENFTLPKGAAVQIDEAWEDWVRVSHDTRGGWVPANAVQLRE